MTHSEKLWCHVKKLYCVHCFVFLSSWFLLQREDLDSEDDKSPDEKGDVVLTHTIPTGTDKTPEILDTALKGFSDRQV